MKVKIAKQNAIITQLRRFALLGSDRQKAYYEQQLKDIYEVNVVKLSDAFTNEEIANIKNIVRPQPRMCYKNSHRLVELFPDKCQYVEGFTTILNGIPIEHAWNKVKDFYVDITFELALDIDVTKELYMALGVYDLSTITKQVSETCYFGGVYNYLYSKKFTLLTEEQYNKLTKDEDK